jgi:hypothetical protein
MRRRPGRALTPDPGRAIPSDLSSTLVAMPAPPSRIDLLELDIDLRLADLWREATTIDEWSLEVVAAFMRAAYGKGYCDALTEELPGSLCADHGYRIPQRTPADA